MHDVSRERLPIGTPREFLAAVLHRILHPRPIVLETRRPVEIPVITETKRRWVVGDRVGAVRYAYEGALADVQRAFGTEFPAHWTHEDILERGVSPEMGSVPDFLVQLLRLYEPVRYGASGTPSDQSPEPILQSIYAHPRMWGLYVAAVPAPPEVAASAAPGAMPPTASTAPPSEAR